MEYKYKMTDPGKMSQDPLYQTLGPLALIATIQQAFSCLLSFQDWPALVSLLPQNNNVSSTVPDNKPLPFSQKCYWFGGNRHVRNCPNKSSKDTNRASVREHKDDTSTS
jgi:hypothetical protein